MRTYESNTSDPGCGERGNCCSDFEEFCDPPAPPPTPHAVRFCTPLKHHTLFFSLKVTPSESLSFFPNSSWSPPRHFRLHRGVTSPAARRSYRMESQSTHAVYASQIWQAIRFSAAATASVPALRHCPSRAMAAAASTWTSHAAPHIAGVAPQRSSRRRTEMIAPSCFPGHNFFSSIDVSKRTRKRRSTLDIRHCEDEDDRSTI